MPTPFRKRSQYYVTKFPLLVLLWLIEWQSSRNCSSTLMRWVRLLSFGLEQLLKQNHWTGRSIKNMYVSLLIQCFRFSILYPGLEWIEVGPGARTEVNAMARGAGNGYFAFCIWIGHSMHSMHIRVLDLCSGRGWSGYSYDDRRLSHIPGRLDVPTSVAANDEYASRCIKYLRSLLNSHTPDSVDFTGTL